MKNVLNFLEFSFVLATQTNSKSGEDVSPIIAELSRAKRAAEHHG